MRQRRINTSSCALARLTDEEPNKWDWTIWASKTKCLVFLLIRKGMGYYEEYLCTTQFGHTVIKKK
jgi:hypothetical protein